MAKTLVDINSRRFEDIEKQDWSKLRLWKRNKPDKWKIGETLYSFEGGDADIVGMV